jgi:hypothetical protein
MNLTSYISPEGLYAVATGGAALLNGTAEGEQRRDAALDRLRERRAALVRRGARLLAGRLLDNGSATMDDIAAELETPPDIDRRLVGAIPSTLAKAGVAVLTGYVRSTRPERHASVIATWGLADRAAAVAWLRDNPDLPDLDGDAAEHRQLPLFENESLPVAADRLSF